MTITRLLATASLVLVCSAQPALAQLRSELVVGGLTFPVAFVQDPSQPNVQVVLEQTGRIRVIQDGVLTGQDFLDLTSQVKYGGEQGLLGLAFAPDYATSRRVYVTFIDLSGNTVIARFLRDGTDPLRADPATRFDLVWPSGLPYIERSVPTHNGGNLMFGPDGYLYVGLGDGGSGNDPFHFAQDPTTLHGKMLRIDVSVSDTHPTGYVVPNNNPFVGQAGTLGEIWAFGLRNPWRYSFDDPARGGTGALIIADVGQGAWEEVNYEPAGQGGRNYGWRNREGAHNNVVTLPPFYSPLTDPIHEYDHSVGKSITGGFVYRGSALGAGYSGRYFFADIVKSRVWSLGLAIDPIGEATSTDVAEHTGELGSGAKMVSSFGVDASGELYLVSYGAGAIYRIAFDGSAPPPPPPSPPPTTSSCQTQQPGTDWTCADGNWYPPGMSVPGAPTPPGPPTPPEPPTPPDPQTPPEPPPSSNGCPSVQPGANWTCANGNWYPPGMSIPNAPGPPSPPAPPEPPTPLPPAPPVPPTSVCSTVQPGPQWTCANDSWYPPGMTIPGPPAPPGAPAPPPGPLPPSPAGCVTPDPFLGIAGLAGICTDGNWTPTELVSDSGTVRFQTDGGGFWAIELDDGRMFVPMGGLPAAFETPGLRVTFTAKLRRDQTSSYGTVIEITAIN